MSFTKYDEGKLSLRLLTPTFAALVLALYGREEDEVVPSSVDLTNLAFDIFADDARRSSVWYLVTKVSNWYMTPAQMLEGTTRVLMYGAAKYSENNWQECKDVNRYHDALLRHCLALVKGEEIDPESGLMHIDHISCNLMFLEYFL